MRASDEFFIELAGAVVVHADDRVTFGIFDQLEEPVVGNGS